MPKEQLNRPQIEALASHRNVEVSLGGLWIRVPEQKLNSPAGPALCQPPTLSVVAQVVPMQVHPHCRARQTRWGLIEEARATAAHAGIDDRSAAERQRQPRNVMEKTFPAIEQMVTAVLNEHPARVANPIQFIPRNLNARG